MKRYLLFTYDQYYPGGGSSDVRGDYDTLEEAKESVSKGWADFKEVLDMETREWIPL
jgi:hypothetical protein